MEKLLFLMHLTAAVILFSPLSHAHGYDEWEHRGRWHHHHHHHHPYYYPRTEIRYYYPQPVIRYYAPPPVIRYYPQPPHPYYPQPPQYQNYNDQRSHQGLAGGVIGSVFGYELGSGDPIATGLGAAAGSFLGNGIAGGYPRGR